HHMRLRHPTAAAFCILAQFATRAAGQAPTSVVVTVRIVDSANAPVADADVSVVRGIANVVAHTATNAAGNARLTVPGGEANLQLVARKIGYQPLYRFFTSPKADSTAMSLTLSRTIATLATVTVNAQEDLKRKSYHIDAEELENSDRTILDA